MANECKVFEMQVPRNPHVPVCTVPFLAKQTLSTTGVSAAFTKSTQLIRIKSSLAGTVEFSTVAGAAPDGTGMTYPIEADKAEDFSVRPGTKVRFV